MTYETYLNIIKETDADISGVIQAAQVDKDLRDFLVECLITHEAINVYYHAYHVLEELAIQEGDILERYIDKLRPLLTHRNSYHRNYGMHLLALTAKNMEPGQLEVIIPDYIKNLDHEKISTKKFVITYLTEILGHHDRIKYHVIEEVVEKMMTLEINPKHQTLLDKTFVSMLISLNIEPSDIIKAYFDSVQDVPALNKLISRYLSIFD